MEQEHFFVQSYVNKTDLKKNKKPEIKLDKKMNTSNLGKKIFYGEDDEVKRVEFGGETFTFTIILTKFEV